MERKLRIAAVALIWLAVGVASAPATDYFADNGYPEAVDTQKQPSMDYFNGKTYVAYQGSNGGTYVDRYNHSTGQWHGPVKVGDCFLTQDEGHAKPAIAVDGNGHIHVVYGGHGGHGPGNENYDLIRALGGPQTLGEGGEQTYKKSDHAEDITGWHQPGGIDIFGTYPQLIRDGSKMYLFYRHGNHGADWVYQKSNDDGASWSNPVRVMKTRWINYAQDCEGWYMWFGKNINGRIDCTYCYHHHVLGTDDGRYHCYYMYMNTSNDSWHKANGNSLNMPLNKASADNHCRVAASSTIEMERGCVHLGGQNNNPWILFQKDELTRFTRWENGNWTPLVTIQDTFNKQEGDFEVLSDTSARAYISYGGDQGRVSTYITTDKGDHWTKESNIFDPGAQHYGISCVVHGGHPNAKILFSTKSNPSNVYCWGESGFLQK